jgi:soluble lytic murein transglycosylase-like protein
MEATIRPMKNVWLQIALAAGLVASIAIGIELSRPLRATREPVAAQIAAHRYIDSSDESVVARALLASAQFSDTTKSLDSTDSRTPWASSPTGVALQSPQFFHDRDSFAMDLVRTGRVGPDRARSLADVAVREAYTRKIPPALVLGVMMTENDTFKSTARSNVGAVGLMQIMPRIWTSTLGRKFGTNLRADSTNLKYGIWILGWLAEQTSKIVVDADDAWRHALLRYNGCVTGSNTPNCHKYPDVVRQHVVQSAKTICGGQTFKECVAEPMWASRKDADESVAAQTR